MRKSCYSDSQILAILKQNEQGLYFMNSFKRLRRRVFSMHSEVHNLVQILEFITEFLHTSSEFIEHETDFYW